jgi:hypothetical protein
MPTDAQARESNAGFLSWHAGFEETFRREDDTVDAWAAYAAGTPALLAPEGYEAP